MLTEVLGPPLDMFISMGSEKWEGMRVPHASPVCGNWRAGFSTDDVSILNTDRLISNLDQIPARERWREDSKLLWVKASLLCLNNFRFVLSTSVLLRLQGSGDVKESS